MSEIPFYFCSPTPRFFRDKGLFKNPKNVAFITWAFERCSPEERTIFHNDIKITLKPYQFIFGRRVCSEETGLTENEVRTQTEKWENAGYLKNTTNQIPNRITNRFTVYEWVLTDFVRCNNQPNPQLNHQPTTNRPPTDHHNQEDKKTRYKESHHPYPSSKTASSSDDDLTGLTDDFLSTEEKEEQPRIEVYKGIALTQQELDACIAVKGSLEAVKVAIEYIMRSPGRKRKIYDWPNALASWQIKSSIKPRLKENEEMAHRLSQNFDSFKKGNGYRCRVFHEKKKDQKGVLFESQSSYIEPVFVPFVDGEFKDKVSKFVRDKKMQKGRISLS